MFLSLLNQRMSAVGAAFALVTLAFSQGTFAAKSFCPELFRSTDSSLASTNFQTTENFRKQVLRQAEEILNILRKGEIDETVKFQLEIERRNELSWANHLEPAIESSETLSSVQMRPILTRNGAVLSITPPAIEAKTLELMKEPIESLSLAASRMSRDPYFIWLKGHALPYELSQKDDLRAIDRSLGGPKDQADPVALYILSRKEGLSPDLALVRVMRNMDPIISPSGVFAASGALYHAKLKDVLITKVIPNLKTRKSPLEGDAWSLMPSLADAQLNLHRLLKEQRLTHGRLFPIEAYDRILNLKMIDSEVLSTITAIRIARFNRVPEAEIIFKHKAQLLFLAEKVGLHKDFPVERVFDAFDRVLPVAYKGAYESVLAEIFDPSAAALIRDLRFMTAIADGLSTREKADAYLSSLVEQ